MQGVKYFINKERQLLLSSSHLASLALSNLFCFIMSAFCSEGTKSLFVSSLWLLFLRLLIVCTVLIHISPKDSVVSPMEQLGCSSLILGQCSEQNNRLEGALLVHWEFSTFFLFIFIFFF